MPVATKYIKIKDKEIPISIKSYKNAKSIKIYFKSNVLSVTKPTRSPIKMVLKMIKDNEEEIYYKYLKVISSEVNTIKQWKTGETIYYKGMEFRIQREETTKNRVSIEINEKEQIVKITVPDNLSQEEIKTLVDKLVKRVLKNQTENLISKKLPYWSKVTGLPYNEVKIRDAISRYGSCMPSKKNLYFSSRLIMLPEDKVDAIIVHELCHFVYKNHNKDFYNLVERFIPNYAEIDKWLKKYGKLIMF